jgi:hypothetical protein
VCNHLEKNMRHSNRFNAFTEIFSFDHNRKLNEDIKTEIENKGKDYILNVDENLFKDYLISKYSFELLDVDFNSEEIDHSKSIENRTGHFGDTYKTDVHNFLIKYTFTGSPILFRIRPMNMNLTTAEITVDEIYRTVSFNFALDENQASANVFEIKKNIYKGNAFGNIANVNNDAKGWNAGLPIIVSQYLTNYKAKYLKENSFLEAINVKVNKNSASVFVPPVIKKLPIPQPTVSKKKEFSSQPTMSEEMYNDVLKVIYGLGKGMENKPATYKGKDEEGLRDQFLLILETRYDATTATGETFNKGGKADIILKYSNDNTNLFVAECKFWHGSSEFLKAISQLFDRYLTWRDSKAALVLFVGNESLTNVLTTIKSDIKNHPNFVKECGERGESSFSYQFNLPQDKERLVYFEVIAFHFDKLKQV